jgi:hypothetical protein
MDSADMKANDLLKRIQNAYFNKLQDPVPVGFKCAKEWGSEWGRSRHAAGIACKRAVELGMMRHIVLKRANKAGFKRVSYFAEVKR